MQLIINATYDEPGNDLLGSLYKTRSSLNYTSKTILGLKDAYVRRCFAKAIEAGLTNYHVADLLSKTFAHNPKIGDFMLRSLPVLEASKLRSDVGECFHLGTKKLSAKLDWEQVRYNESIRFSNH